MNPNSSAGPDGIPPLVLKECAGELAPTLHKIFRESIDTGKLPLDWKTAEIIPIFKKGSKVYPSNYRPISLTSSTCKVLERIIANELLNFALRTGSIPAQQHGFIPGRSIMTNLLSSLLDWITEQDKGNPTDIIYLDFSKAFDKVPHRRLLGKLAHLGIKGKLLRWVKSFLESRQFWVRNGDSKSQKRVITSGVPQGSVLGPILFILYTSDLPLGRHSEIKMYADDTKLYANPLVNYQHLQEDLDKIHNWSKNWMLPLNEAKCIVMHIGKSNPKRSYHIGGENITEAIAMKDLGIMISNDLKWANHVNYISTKANKAIYTLRKAFE